MMLGLLAAAPMASQAAMVEMDDAALSKVEGQGFSYGFNLNPALLFSFSNTPTLIGVSGDAHVVPTVSVSHVNNAIPARKWSFASTGPYLGGDFKYTHNK